MSRQTAPAGRPSPSLALGALGVVYGDIGTSPLYALKECFIGPHGVPVTKDNVLGVLSLVFWSLNFVVTFKYLTVVHAGRQPGRRRDPGAAGAGAPPRGRAADRPSTAGWSRIGLFGAALLYGDGIITPAISVLGAVEGLSVATPALQQLGGADRVSSSSRRCSPFSGTARRRSARSSGR